MRRIDCISSGEDKTSNKLLQEISNGVKDERDRKNSLDSKATTMVVISATVASLLIGFSGSLILRIDPTYPFFSYIIYFLTLGLILTIVSIFIFLFSSSPKRYVYSYIRMIEHIDELSVETLNRRLVMDYLRIIEVNSHTNLTREKIIFYGQLVFVFQIALILISVLLQIHAITMGEITSS